MAKTGASTSITKKGLATINLKAKQTGNQNQPSKNSKFLLGGNIRDPLNLNSLSDERVAKAINAVTPESSPLPTPKHRKAEYKIEVLVPPNISDPLNLMNADAGDIGSSAQGGKKPRLRKRTRSAKQSRDSRDTKPPDVNYDSETLSATTQTLLDPEKESKGTCPEMKECEDKEMSDCVTVSSISDRNLFNVDAKEGSNFEGGEQVYNDGLDQNFANTQFW